MPKPSNAYVPRKGAVEKTYTNADGKKVKYYSVGGDDKKKAGAGERPLPSVPGKTFRQTGPTTVSAHGGGDGTFGAAPKPETAKSTTGKTYQEQQNEKNMHSPGSAVKPGQRNPSYAGSSAPAEEAKKPEAEKPEAEKPETAEEQKHGESGGTFGEKPREMSGVGIYSVMGKPVLVNPDQMQLLTEVHADETSKMFRDTQRQNLRDMPEQLYDVDTELAANTDTEYDRFINEEPLGTGKWTSLGFDKEQAEYYAKQEYLEAKKKEYAAEGINFKYAEILAEQDYENEKKKYDEGVQPLYWEKQRAQAEQRSALEAANAEYSKARADALHELNMEDIQDMPMEDRKLLEAADWIGKHPAERAMVVDALKDKYGKERAEELVEAMEWEKSEKRVADAEAKGRDHGSRNLGTQIGGNAASVWANLAASVMAPGERLDELLFRTGQYPTLNPYTEDRIPAAYASGVRDETAKAIEGENGNWFRKGLSYAYQGTMSAADSLARLAVAGEAGGLALAGLGQFGSAVSEASERGATPGQAVCYGVTTASVEVLTEKIPMDDWLKIAKGGKQPLTVAVKNAFKQAGVEITTEEISFVADLMLDATIMQGKSGYNQQVRELEAQGYSRTDAENMASKALLWEAFDTLMVSGFSGGGSSAVGSVIAGVTDSGNQQDAKAGAGADQVGQKTNRDVQGMTDDVFGVQQPQIAPAQQEQQAGPQQGPQADLQSMTDDAMGVQQGQPQAAEALTEDFQQRLDGQEQQARDNQDMFDQAAEIAPQLGEDVGKIDQSPEDVQSAINEVLGVAEAPQTAVDTEAAQGYNNLNENKEGVNGNGYEYQQAADGGTELQGLIQTSENGDGGWSYQREVTPGETRDSKAVTNTALHNGDQDVRAATRNALKDNPDAAKYNARHEADVESAAKNNVSTPEAVQYSYDSLMNADQWNDVDMATANELMKTFAKEKNVEAFNDILAKRKDMLTEAGRAVNAAKIGTMGAAKDTVTAVESFQTQLDSLGQEQTTFGKGLDKEAFQAKKQEVKDNVARIGFEIEDVAEGDTHAMQGIIRQIAKERGTTAWFGKSNRLAADAQAVLNTMQFSDLKTVANAQIASMADDFRSRTKTEIAQGIRVNNMLSSVKTILRNLGGNSVGGITGALSDSSVGQFADVLLSKFTGKRTVGNDLTHGATYAKGAWNAAKFASMCVELNIPIETSISGLETAFDGKNGNKFVGKTWRANGNLVQRLLYANQKYMSYALEVSDKIFEGGTNAAVTKSLENLKNSGLSQDEVQQLAEYEANKRTFKDATWTDGEGDEHGATLSRAAQGIKNADFIKKNKKAKKVVKAAMGVPIPFASVPMNVTQAGIDYTAGVAKGVGEIVSIMKDAKNGKDIDVARQRQAVTDFGKGLTGTGLIALAAAAAASGAIKVSNDKDKDKRALEQAQGLSGAQINWSAIERGLRGESTKWQDGDVISSLDFLEPFNTQLYLGWELSRDDSVVEMVKDLPQATVKSVFSSLMDSPMMQGIQDIRDLIGDLSDAETGEEQMQAAAGYAGDVMGSFIPQWMRQAAQYTDGYYRDTRGHSAAETAWNQIKAGIPGASESLPKKYSGLGEVQERPGFMGTFIDPTNTHTYHPNEVTDELARISDRNGGAYSIYPDAQAPMTIKDGGETITLTGEQRETYQQEYGSLVNEYYKGIMDSAEYPNMTDEERIEAFEKAEKKATEEAKATITGNRVEVSEEVAAGLEELRKNNPSDYSYLPDKAVPTSISVDGEDIRLTTEQRKTYQEKYSEKVNDYYGALMENEGFQGLSEDRKKEALQKAKEYAADHAKAAVSDFSDVQKGFGRDVAVRIVNDVALKSITDIFGDIDTNTKKGSSNADNLKALDAAYDRVLGLPEMQRDKVLGDAESDAAIYFDARESGVETWDFIQARDAVNSAPGSGSADKDTGKPKQTNADKYGAIAGLERMTDDTIDRLMKAWMPDYDPDNGKTDRAELKYDYARKKLRLSPSQYAEAYRVNGQYSLKDDKMDAWKAMGLSDSTAETLYKLLGGHDTKFNQMLVELYG